MELLELYDAKILDQAIAVAIDENCMDIKSFRMLMKEYNAGLRTFEKKTDKVSCAVIPAYQTLVLLKSIHERFFTDSIDQPFMCLC